MREARPSLVETSLEIELQDPRLVAELIAAIPVGMALVHPFDLRIMAANPAMASALEVVPEALLGARAGGAWRADPDPEPPLHRNDRHPRNPTIERSDGHN